MELRMSIGVMLLPAAVGGPPAAASCMAHSISSRSASSWSGCTYELDDDDGGQDEDAFDGSDVPKGEKSSSSSSMRGVLDRVSALGVDGDENENGEDDAFGFTMNAGSSDSDGDPFPYSGAAMARLDESDLVNAGALPDTTVDQSAPPPPLPTEDVSGEISACDGLGDGLNSVAFALSVLGLETGDASGLDGSA